MWPSSWPRRAISYFEYPRDLWLIFCNVGLYSVGSFSCSPPFFAFSHACELALLFVLEVVV